MLKKILLSLPRTVKIYSIILYKVSKTFHTSNLSKAHVTRDGSGPATLAISVQHAIKY